MHGDNAGLYWTDRCATPPLRGFVVEMMAAVAGMSRWLTGERLPWQFRFNRTQPPHTEQYAVHLGASLRFNDYLDAMSLPAALLDRPWPRRSAMAVSAALAGVAEGNLHRSLLASPYQYLSAQQIAEWLGFHDANNFRRSLKLDRGDAVRAAGPIGRPLVVQLHPWPSIVRRPVARPAKFMYINYISRYQPALSHDQIHH